jgi:hypothetical protein
MGNTWIPWEKEKIENEKKQRLAEIRAHIRAKRKLEELNNVQERVEVEQEAQQSEQFKWLREGIEFLKKSVGRRTSDVIEKTSESVSGSVEKEEPRSIEYTVPKGMRKIVVTINGKKSYTITNYITIEDGDKIKLEVK